MKKRILASILVMLICASSLPLEVFANLQSPLPVGGISKNSTVGHSAASNVIIPKVALKFQPPVVSGLPDPDPTAEDGSTGHLVSHYQVHISEYPSGESFKAPDDPSQLEVGKITEEQGILVQDYTSKLKNGRLYKMSIIPYHRHKYKVEDDEIIKWAPHTIPISSHPYIYVLTDFDTKVEGKESSLEVTWEDSGYSNMEYRIGYIQGNYEGKSLDEIKSNSVGNNIQYIDPIDIKNNAEKYTDPQTNRTRFRYTIKNNIATGQMYSAFVTSTTTSIAGETILKNDSTPKVATATTQIGLSVFNVGKDKIRLEWSSQLPYLMDGSYKLEQTQIKEYGVGDESGRVIATLHHKEGANIGYYEYREPKENTYYQLIFIYKNETQQLIPAPQTAKVLYVPGELRVKPVTPEIPKPIGINTKVTEDNRTEFLLSNDTLVDVSVGDMWKSDHTFHANMVNPPSLNFVWSAYMEDLSLLYDIWITDDITVAQSEVSPIIQNLSFAGGQNTQNILYNKETGKVVGFKHTIKEYYNSNMSKLSLVPNKVYYVKIVAKKQYGDEFEYSIPATVTIMFNSDGEVFAPPIISKPPLRLEPDGLGTTSITIGWLESWYEILAKNPNNYTDEKEREKAKQWNSKVYTGSTTGAAISFVKREEATEHILKRSQDIARVKTIVGTSYYDNNYIDRSITLGKNVNYEYKLIPYDEILQGLRNYNTTVINNLTVEEYIEMLMKNETDPEQDYGWRRISPKTEQDEEYIEWKKYTESNLKPNTSYVFFVKPYSFDYDGSKLQASLPTWIVVTTLPDGEMPEGKPTVPILSLNGKGDSHISVEWEYNSNFEYEIRYSRLEDPEKATVWPFTIGTEIDDPTYVEHGGRAIVTINGLFPDTTYHVWIRAKQKKGQEVSAWSNPVTAKTDLLGTPTSPAGLGVASYQSILEAGKDFQPVGENHITVEWQRNSQDKDLDNINQDGQRVQKEYKYIIEIADNPEFLDVQTVTVAKDNVGSKEGSAEVLSRSMVHFEGLIANRPYYIRAKTLLIAHDTENNRDIVMESDYTKFVRIITKPSQDEYDGGDKVNEVIYPEKIKQTYDGTTWTYEILDTQKVINEIVSGNQYKYVVPVQKYRSIYDPKYRVVRIPGPIVQALINRSMQLEIKTNALTIQIQGTSLSPYIQNAGANGIVEFKFETLSASDLYPISMGYEYQLISTPETMSINVKGTNNAYPVTQVSEPMKLKVNMPNRTDYITKNIGAYTYNPHKGIWEKGNNFFNKVDMQMEYTTGIIGTYTVYELKRATTPAYTTSQSMQNILQSYDILGLGTKYTASMTVGTNEYINIMLGFAEQRNTIIPDATVTNVEINKAQRSGIYIDSPTAKLNKEIAISGIVKLYELTHGVSIRTNSNVNVNSVTAKYRENINKAYSVGIIDTTNQKGNITYQELFDLIEAVLE